MREIREGPPRERESEVMGDGALRLLAPSSSVLRPQRGTGPLPFGVRACIRAAEDRMPLLVLVSTTAK